MSKQSTQSIKADREAKLKNWFEQVRKDGCYSHWVQEKYQCLDTPKVAKEILGANDNSMFKGSGWGVWYRDEFNKEYNKKRKQQQYLVARCNGDEHFEISLDDESLDKFLESFLSTENSRPLANVNRNTLKSLLNSYSSLSSQRYLFKIGKLQDEIKALQSQAKKNEKRMMLLKEEVSLLKTRGEEEERHFMGSIRNLYAYDTSEDVDEFD